MDKLTLNQKEILFVGNGKSYFDGNVVSINLNLSDLNKFIEEYSYDYNRDGDNVSYIKLDVVKKLEQDKFGNTHYIKVNTYYKDNKNGNQNEADEKRVGETD